MFSSASPNTILQLAKRYDYWMKQYHGHDGSDNTELVYWLYHDYGAAQIESYAQFCLLAKKLTEFGYKTNPPPTEFEYCRGVYEYYHRRGALDKIPKVIADSLVCLPQPSQSDYFANENKAEINLSHYQENLLAENKAVNSVWYRVGGDFYQNMQGSKTIDRMVRFRNPVTASMIKEIEIYRYKEREKGFLVLLYTSPFKHDEVVQYCKDVFFEKEYEVVSTKIRIHFNLISTFNKLMTLFECLNKKSEREEIPREIVVELTKISDYLHHSGKTYSHIIAEREESKAYINPDRVTSQALNELMNSPQDRKPTLQQIKSLLKKGEDPNQQNTTGWSPIYCAVCADYDITVIKLLLVYHANPFRRDNGLWFESAIEKAKHDNRIDVMNVFVSYFSTPKKSIASPKLGNMQIFRKNNIVTTLFEFNNQLKLKTDLKPIELLKSEEKQIILSLFKKLFVDPMGNTNNNDVLKIFEEDFGEVSTTNKKLIEIIKVCDLKTGEETIVGFNLFSILFEIISNPKTHVVVCEYSGLEEAYRKIGIGFILLFRVAFGLQPLVDAPILIHFSAINYNSYRLVEDLVHTPKYQPEHAQRTLLINEILREEYQENLMYYHNDATTFIFDSLSVKDEKTQGKSIGLEFFEKEILGFASLPSHPTTFTRGGFVLVDVADEFLLKIHAISAVIGLNFLEHMQLLSEHLASLLNLNEQKPNVHKLLKNYPSTRALFWKPTINHVPATINLANDRRLTNKLSHL